MAISIYINNVERVTEARCIMEVAQELGLPERGVALAVNNRVIPRAEWADTPVSEGDKVTVIKAAFGG